MTAAEYAKLIGKSVSTARRELERKVVEGKASKRYVNVDNPINYRRVGISQWMPNLRVVEYTISKE